MKLIYKTIISVGIAGTLAAMVAVPAFAQVNIGGGITVTANTLGSAVAAGLRADIKTNATGSGSGTGLANRMANVEGRGDTGIQNRIDTLNALNTRVNGMYYVTSTDKATIAASIQSQISTLTSLEAKIQTDASSSATSSLKTDVQSITKAYRIYMLVVPQGAIAAAADRVDGIVAMFQTLGTKLSARISAAEASGTNVTAMQSAYADFTAKLSDAQTQAQAAVSETATLTPDQGVTSTMQANTTALKDARAKIQTAQQDLVAARKDAGIIVKDLSAIKVSAAATVTATSSSQ